ncbi:MAG: iron-sulfur cluster carrier protein ApbC [Marinobacterium sp.]|nr:iron-sulfur cluster carrier protein ApbC [Marinobacterium sp.]
MFEKLFGKKNAGEPLPATLQATLDKALAQLKDPYLQQAPAQEAATLQGNTAQLVLSLPYPAAGIAGQLEAPLREALLADSAVEAVDIEWIWQIARNSTPRNLPGMAEVKNIIAVASGKGGVGKSTTTVNLALAMAAEGARVGVLDADIYGPSIGQMLGVASGTRPDSSDDEQYFIPVESLGLQSMSMAYLIDDNTPMVWRGPMVSGALQQLLTQTKWDGLDYLFIDMPPGTGDIQLTLSQKVPVTGSVVVTTPQDIALLDAIKGIEMFNKVDIPVLGVVENMSVHICSNCGHAEHIFGEGGGEKIASQYGTRMLGNLPLALEIRQQADAGQPTVATDADSSSALIYREIARQIATGLIGKNEQGSAIPSISIVDD